ncbi:hypothetical protein BX285_3829 [Streptomyces sp. 1114.5]|uniref:hypothetical protein n=1 Tax=Streptomyces sp. 1114.5 TaxID=1938830 RepID=UPI000EB05831|nr:hypothetical protein [Streptomyces sp. 1114.5]RKT19372.1 hypothetical protein BX285_3829 [Streptomyces sp. 1114.5]
MKSVRNRIAVRLSVVALTVLGGAAAVAAVSDTGAAAPAGVTVSVADGASGGGTPAPTTTPPGTPGDVWNNTSSVTPPKVIS